METTEKIVEAYVRYVKGWATIANIRCQGQYEIDLLAIDPVGGGRYHIESTVSVSGAYSKLTAKPYDPELLKQRGRVAGQRRTIDYFAKRKLWKNNCYLVSYRRRQEKSQKARNRTLVFPGIDETDKR